ncbi:hypothetical protein OH77DRAFT_335489 [Trametes cingulata]|nr:hypothetical protein OH77DRAFT_335489 [Trametes cingulata]
MVVVMVVVRRTPCSRSGAGVPRVRTTGGVALSGRRALGLTSSRNLSGRRGEECAARSGSCHGEVGGTSARRTLARSCMTVSDHTCGRSVDRTRSPWGRAHREVAVRLERDDAVLDPHTRDHALVVDVQAQRWCLVSKNFGGSPLVGLSGNGDGGLT